MIGYLYRRFQWFRDAADNAFFNHKPNKDKALQEYAFYSKENGAKVYNYFREDFKNIFISEQNKATDLYTALQYVFTDLKGKKWYKFPKDQLIPIERIAETEKYVTLMHARLTSDQLNELCEKAQGFIEAGLGVDKNAARLSAIVMEIADRNNMLVPYQLMLNRLALLYVREDEHPEELDQKIHMEKVEQLFEESKIKDGFFFRMPELNEVIGWSVTSNEEWNEYVKQSDIQSENLKKAIQIFVSG